MVGAPSRNRWRSSGTRAGRWRAAVLLALGGAPILAACYSGPTNPDLAVPLGRPDRGAQVLEEELIRPTCDACHTLEAAGWEAPFAPNLGLMQPGFERILTAITDGPGAMPSYQDQLSDQQLRDLAAFVAEQVSLSDDG